MTNIPIFDGHNDTILKLHQSQDSDMVFFNENAFGHIDLPRAKKGKLGGGFFAAFTPNENYHVEPEKHLTKTGYDMPLPPPIDQQYALNYTNALAAILFKLEIASKGALKVVKSKAELTDCLNQQILAAIFHIEGAEAIDTDFHALHVFYQAGLRSLGIVWSRPNQYGEGVPFRYPSTPDIGGGLTDAGKRLVKECNQLGIMIDTTHLNEKGFWDVVYLSNAPIVATHSNVHAICPISRNLTDEQLQAIKDSDGVVGINYAINMLRADGQFDTNIPLDTIVEHISYIAENYGVDHVALGSDFDGTRVPDSLKDVTGLPRLIDRLKVAGFTEKETRKIAYENWVRVLGRTWKD
ncbi:MULTISPECIES: dipeptidase [Clostridia]|uniref:dipeptidase n=1 Tax=Clostridia TaxID=186801 RepID=UPI000EA241BA|nr:MULTISPECIES: dipeptidase [Clostridia]NBJ71080.1 membrane dipeptidase [Roseburia sp. 1XD42-34]RKI75266.1 membrane dipeptidase [Clostridium sp. 1xD42-85]